MKTQFGFLKTIFLVLLFSAGALQAQWRVTVQPYFVAPTGYFYDVAEAGFGAATGVVWYPLGTEVEFELTAGYQLSGYSNQVKEFSFKHTAALTQFNIRYNFDDENFVPYLTAGAGGYFTKYNLVNDFGVFGKETIVTPVNSFGLNGGAGFRLSLSPSADLDVSCKYNRILTKYYGRAFVALQWGLGYRL